MNESNKTLPETGTKSWNRYMDTIENDLKILKSATMANQSKQHKHFEEDLWEGHRFANGFLFKHHNPR